MHELLTSIGLSLTESKIYLTLLDKGELKAGEIVSYSKINSGRLYEILDALQSKGFISCVVKDGVKFFSAAPPTILRDYLEKQENELTARKARIDDLLPQLMKKYSSVSSDISVEVFLGKKGMRSSYEILYAQKNTDKKLFVLGVSAQLSQAKWVPLFIKTYIYPIRKRLKFKIKKIMDVGSRSNALFKEDKSTIRFAELNSLTSYEILGSVVVIQIMQGDGIFLVIRGEQVANDFKNQFNLLWKQAEK